MSSTVAPGRARTLEELTPALSARSVALSLLLGARPPRMTARDLTGLGERFGVSVSTMRVALSRMAAGGDLVADGASCTLSERHLRRRALTDALIHPRRRPHDGTWVMAVVVERGRSAPERADLRTALEHQRFAELREGVWLRPANVDGVGRVDVAGLRTFTVIPDADDARGLCRELWDLPTWAREARTLLDALATDDAPGRRLAVAAAAVRHLRTDPALPDELAPERWPAEELRWAYEDFRTELETTHLTDRTAGAAPGPRPRQEDP